MTGYTKLFGSLIASTVWRDTKDVKILWVTMLAMKNEFDIVEASAPGLADMARLTVEETRAALIVLESPDPDSRTTDFEGRRIRKIDGGWLIINGEKYRCMMNADEQKTKTAERVKRFRERRKGKCNADVTECNAHVTHVTTDRDRDRDIGIEKEPEKSTSSIQKTHESGRNEDPAFLRFWSAYPNRTGKGKARQIFKSKGLREIVDKIMVALEAQKRKEQWMRDEGKFIPHPATWLNQERWEDEGIQQPTLQRKALTNLENFK